MNAKEIAKRVHAIYGVNSEPYKVAQAYLDLLAVQEGKVLVPEEPTDERLVRCHHGSTFATDWCQADAMRDSLREHMALLKAAYEKIEKLEAASFDEIVVGDRFIATSGAPQGTILGLTNWDKRMLEAGLSEKWCQIIIRPARIRNCKKNSSRVTGE